MLNADGAIPLSLIANELTIKRTPSLLYTGSLCVATLTLVADDALIRMTIADGRAGLSVSPLRPSLGTPVAQPLAKQIGAAITTQSEPDQSTIIHVSMKLYSARAAKFATTYSGK